ncbi:hypothetical protein [Rhodococcus kronopolitis]|uniref:Uncharacterized protein n=1 Tax=Rhodococcus kronopolitis TaxID=1460226 RepID=A0ABV9FJD7_9NOCA
MTAADWTTAPHTGAPRRAHHVNLAGTDWPLYKLEALVVGLLVFVVTLAVTTALQPAVLLAAGATVTAWWVRRAHWARARD